MKCRKEEHRLYRQNNKEKLLQYRQRTRERHKANCKVWREKNKEWAAEYRKANRKKYNWDYTKARAARIKRIPKWLTKEEKNAIGMFYANCPEGMVVDHIIPLRGKDISGLHVLSNLQYLSVEENNKKGNSYDI